MRIITLLSFGEMLKTGVLEVLESNQSLKLLDFKGVLRDWLNILNEVAQRYEIQGKLIYPPHQRDMLGG